MPAQSTRNNAHLSRYDGYRLVAVLDRIKLRVQLSSASQFPVIRRLLEPTCGNIFVEANTDSWHGTTCSFSFWVQDPGSVAELRDKLSPLAALLDPAAPIWVEGLELALDALIAAPSVAIPMAELAAYLCFCLSRRPEGDAKITWSEHFPSGKRWRRFSAIGRRQTLQEHLEAGHSAQIGHRHSPDTARVYVKRNDTRDGCAYKPLPESEHRVRLERTLTGPMLSIQRIEDLADFKFESLTKLFAQRLWSGDAPPWLAEARDQYRLTGKPTQPVAAAAQRRAHRRVHTAGTHADSATYNLIRDALRRLNTRVRKKTTSTRSPLGSQASLGAFSGDFDVSQQSLSEGDSAERTASPKYIKGEELKPQQASGEGSSDSCSPGPCTPYSNFTYGKPSLGRFSALPMAGVRHDPRPSLGCSSLHNRPPLQNLVQVEVDQFPEGSRVLGNSSCQFPGQSFKATYKAAPGLRGLEALKTSTIPRRLLTSCRLREKNGLAELSRCFSGSVWRATQECRPGSTSPSVQAGAASAHENVMQTARPTAAFSANLRKPVVAICKIRSPRCPTA